MLEDVRYKDKKALIKYDLNIDMLKNYNFIVEDVIPVRKVFILITNEGNKVLKRLDYGVDNIEYIYEAMNYIRKHSFYRVFNFQLTKGNKPYVIWGNEMYCVTDLIEARESEYTNPIDVNIAARGIGELHKASEGFRYKNKIRYNCGNTIKSFKRKLQEMDLFRNIAVIGEDKTEFDDIFLKNVDFYKDQIEDSIKVLEKSNFYKLCGEEDKVVLCHHDLAHHNILIKDDEAYFVDFDYSIIDLKVHDLCNFINKVEKISSYDIENAKSIIENYCVHNELNNKELQVLYGLLIFPQDFYNVVKGYYTRTKDWEYGVFLDKLIKKNDFKEDRVEFLEKFRENIL